MEQHHIFAQTGQSPVITQLVSSTTKLLGNGTYNTAGTYNTTVFLKLCSKIYTLAFD